jgi:hypothetical protein
MPSLFERFTNPIPLLSNRGECGRALIRRATPFNPKSEIGRDGALRRPRAVQARNNFGKVAHRGSIRSARCTRAGTAQRAIPTDKS